MDGVEVGKKYRVDDGYNFGGTVDDGVTDVDIEIDIDAVSDSLIDGDNSGVRVVLA